MFKLIFGTALALCFSTANAATIHAGEELMTYKCKIQNMRSNSKYTIKVTALETVKLEEGSPVRSVLTVQRILPFGHDAIVKPMADTVGQFQFEDVMNQFASTDGQTFLTVYADELDQTVLTQNEQKTYFDCNPQE